MFAWRRQLLSILLEPKLRPWAMLTPVVVLLLAIPLLRPLLLPTGATEGEKLLLATVDSIANGNGMALDPTVWMNRPGTVVYEGRVFASRPPVYAVSLAAVEWLLQRAGISLQHDEALAEYLLTLIGVTLPVAVGAGVVYRMGRLFELDRPRRALLALLCVLGGGWISYATVLNPHAPGAALLMCAYASVLYVAAARRPMRVIGVLALGGLLSMLAATVDPWTLPLIVPLPLVVLSMQLPLRSRLIGALVLTLGAAPIVWLHCAWSLSVFGSVWPPSSVSVLRQVAGADLSADGSAWSRLGGLGSRLLVATVGSHGVLIHFPIIAFAFLGLFRVLRRHWPRHAKMLAAIVFVGTLTVVMLVCARSGGLDGSMFAVRWFVVFTPAVLFWLGALLRRAPQRWMKAALLLAGAISVAVSIVGARQPLPRAAAGERIAASVTSSR